MPRTPKYCHYKATGQAFVRINGKQIYLGAFESPDSRDAYDVEIVNWKSQQSSFVSSKFTVGQLCIEFLKHADIYYRDGD